MNKATWILALLALTAPVLSAETPEQTLQRAQRLETEGKVTQAVEVYRAFVKAHGEHSQAADAHYRLAKCLDGLGLVDEAIGQLGIATGPKFKRYRNRQEAFYTLGKLLASVKKYDHAAKVFEKLLVEGAGLYEDEVLALCGGYYAVLKKYDEAAVKFSLLKRRKNSRFAEQAAYKLAMLWIRAEKLTLAVKAVEDFASRYPRSKQARGLMVQVAEMFRAKKQYDQAIAVCSQIQSRFPRSYEAQVVGYVIGMCYRDQKKYDDARKAFEAVAKLPENRKSGLAAEALLQSADILFRDLAQPDRAMQRYTEAAKMARDATSERQARIREQCYFRLAEYHFAKKQWAVALENYLLLRRLGTSVNILPRILQCQTHLDVDQSAAIGSAADVELIEKQIAANPGTFMAAEAQVFLADRKMNEAMGRKGGFGPVIEAYEAVLKKYPQKILAQQSLESYVLSQLGICYGQGVTKADWARSIAAFEKALTVDPRTPYRVAILENMARVADAAGDKRKAFEVYKRLFEMTAQRLEKGETDQALQERTAEYIRAMLTRADQSDSITEALAVAKGIIDKKGPFSTAARHAMFYVGELYYLRKDFSAGARTYTRFIKAYGPKQDANGDVAGGPWKPTRVDEKVQQVFEAAVRVAHCWHMQGHSPSTIKAYQWIVRNFCVSNKHLAEAQYWLAVEMGKGRKGKEKENRRKMAEAFWKNVVNTSFDFDSRDYKKSFHFWVDDEEVAKYVKPAILKAGQALSELKDHDRAAGVFAEYLKLYPAFGSSKRGRRKRTRGEPKVDEMYSIALYALGREYIAMGNSPAMVECYGAYVDRMRADRFRASGLRLLGYHAGKAGLYDSAIEAYATLLDEYGENEKDSKGNPRPVPTADRIRTRKYAWNGIRSKPPKGLDLGQVRYSLGFLYWKQEQWARSVKALLPFVTDPRLFANRSRPEAIYMVARSYYKVHDYDSGVQVILKLIRDHPKFEAVEEAHVYAARGCVRTGKWADIIRLNERFAGDWPRSAFRPHMDLYTAVAVLSQGQADKGLARLKTIAESDTYGDVKAGAHYHMGTHLMARKPPDLQAAAKHLDQSVALYPREFSCLAAAKCHMRTKNWQRAKSLLDRTIRDFPSGDQKTVKDAKELLPEVLKQLARQGK